jgi:hypothetical protein
MADMLFVFIALDMVSICARKRCSHARVTDIIFHGRCRDAVVGIAVVVGTTIEIVVGAMVVISDDAAAALCHGVVAPLCRCASLPLGHCAGAPLCCATATPENDFNCDRPRLKLNKLSESTRKRKKRKTKQYSLRKSKSKRKTKTKETTSEKSAKMGDKKKEDIYKAVCMSC